MDLSDLPPRDDTPIEIQPLEVFMNSMIIEVPDELRAPNSPYVRLVTIDRSVPGYNFAGNAILDQYVPGLPKVTPFDYESSGDEELPPRRVLKTPDLIEPEELPPGRAIHTPDLSEPVRDSHLNRGRPSRSSIGNRNRSPVARRQNRYQGDNRRNRSHDVDKRNKSHDMNKRNRSLEVRNRMIYPDRRIWLPGMEPYLPSVQNVVTGNKGPLNSHVVNTNAVHKYRHSGDFGDGPPYDCQRNFANGLPPNNPGSFIDDPQPNFQGQGSQVNYPVGFREGPQSPYQELTGDVSLRPNRQSSQGLLLTPPQGQFNQPHWSQSHGDHPMNNSFPDGNHGLREAANTNTSFQGGNHRPREAANSNTSFQGRNNLGRFQNRGHSQNHRNSFQSQEGNAGTCGWIRIEDTQAPNTNGANKTNFRQRGGRKPFARRGRRNYR